MEAQLMVGSMALEFAQPLVWLNSMRHLLLTVGQMLYAMGTSNILATTGGSLVLCQGLKAFFPRRFNQSNLWRRLVEPGGMPSSHAAVVTTLSVTMGFDYGWTSMPFQMAAVFGGIVIYDALTLRRAVGYHASLLKELHSKVFPGQKPEARLPESLGHNPLEVLAGMLIGILMALALL